MNSARLSNQSLHVCTACRSRKVSCDGRRATCGNCERLGFSCSYPDDPITLASAGLELPPRRRGHNACAACRQRKIRCSAETPKCGRCKKKSIECVYMRRRSRHDPAETEAETELPSSPARGVENRSVVLERTQNLLSPSVSDFSTEAAIQLDLPPSLAANAMKTFFDEISCVPVFSFLHRASIMEEHRTGTLDRALFLAIVGMACVVIDFGPSVSETGTKYIDAAQALVVLDLDNPTITKIQALILIIQHRALSRRFATVFMLMALAARSALGLRLNYENTRLPFLARESCRRAIWSLFMIDTMTAAGYDDFALFRESLIHVQLPCQDHNFQMDIPQTSEFLHEASPAPNTSKGDLSPAALVIRMLSLRQRVLQHTKAAGAQQPHDVATSVVNFKLQLDAYLERLPQSFQLSVYNFRLHAHMPTFIAYMKIHLTWLGVNCILYRLVLPGLKESLSTQIILSLDPGFRADCEAKCLSSARSMAELFEMMLRLGPESVIVDLDLAVMVYQCARIFVYFYRNSQADISQEEVETALESCKGLLHQKFCQSIAVSEIRNDLSSLTRHCFSSTDADGSLDEGQESTVAASSSEETPHILSKHSLIRQMDLKRRSQSNLPPLEALKGYADVAERSSYETRTSMEAAQGSQMHVGGGPAESDGGLISLAEATSTFQRSPRGLAHFDPLLFDLSLPDFDVGSSSWIVTDH